jgi:membrane protein
MSIGFGIYAQNFGSYNATYGSLGSVIVFLTWLYLSAYIVLMAGELNAEMEHETLADTTVGDPKPFGDRGAHVADTAPDDMAERVDVDTLDALHRRAAENQRIDSHDREDGRDERTA